MLQYNLTVKCPWGDGTKGNADLVDLTDFTTKLLKLGLPFRILLVETKGPMRDRHLELVLGFADLGPLEQAQSVLAKQPKLPKYSEEQK